MSEVKTIVVYSTPTCPYCKQVKDYLTGKGIAFTDLNVGADLEAREAMKMKSNQMGVPVIDIDGTVVVGFNKTKLDTLLA
jgi:glutaredoxin 3